MMKKMLNIRGQKGAAAIEFAIVLPVLVLLLFGTIEFGLLLYNQQVMTNASREGARFGIVSQTPRKTSQEISNVVANYCGGRLITFGDDAAAGPFVSVSSTGTGFQDDLTVLVTYNYDFLVLSNLGFSQKVLSGQTVMKYE
jgi:Flp pilus assembly protein TadG